VIRIRAGAVSLVLVVLGVLAAAPCSGQIAPGAPRHVEILGDPGLRDLGVSLAADPSVWRSFPGIGTLPEIGVDSLEIWLAADLSRDVPEGLRHPESWAAGTANPSGARIALRTGPGLTGPGGLKSVLRHELAHVALAAATDGNYSRWLTEGYAQYASGEWSWEDAWHLQSVFLSRGAATLEEIDLRFRRHSAEARLGYLLSYTAVHELAALGGEAGLAGVFRRLREGATFEEAVWRTYGITAEALETRWKRSLVDRYGWLYLFSRTGAFWLAVTGLVLFVALRRARRDKVRLAELRADELWMTRASEMGVPEWEATEMSSVSSVASDRSGNAADSPGSTAR
jgi:hypothetical protein